MNEIHDLAKTLRYELTALQAKVSELLRMTANLPDTTRVDSTCPDCGLKFAGPRTLSEHTYITHGGPEPTHWLEAEQRSSV